VVRKTLLEEARIPVGRHLPSVRIAGTVLLAGGVLEACATLLSIGLQAAKHPMWTRAVAENLLLALQRKILPGTMVLVALDRLALAVVVAVAVVRVALVPEEVVEAEAVVRPTFQVLDLSVILLSDV